MAKYGTNYFPTRGNAIRYYRDIEGADAAKAVDRKLAEGSIHAGELPPTKPGDRVTIEDCRYHVTEREPQIMTRAQYMAGEVSHSAYYGQFVTQDIKALVLRRFPLAKLLATKDQENFNSIPLSGWDAASASIRGIDSKLREAGDGPTLAGKVCILKTAAKQLIAEARA
jgi:hypothetical protein